MLNPSGHAAKTAYNRKWSSKYLLDHNVNFKTSNNGAHLIIENEKGVINFWPGTGLFMSKGLSGRGVRNLVLIIQGKKDWKVYNDSEGRSLNHRNRRRFLKREEREEKHVYSDRSEN